MSRNPIPIIFLMFLGACSPLNSLLEAGPRDCQQRQAWYPDADGDGLGTSDVVWLTCEQPDGYVAAPGDCDDSDPAILYCDDSTMDTGDSR